MLLYVLGIKCVGISLVPQYEEESMKLLFVDRHGNILLAPFTIYIIALYMETDNTNDGEPLSIPYWSMHQDIQDMRRGLKTFEEVRQTWAFWARRVLQEEKGQAEGRHQSHRQPDLNSADTTA